MGRPLSKQLQSDLNGYCARLQTLGARWLAAQIAAIAKAAGAEPHPELETSTGGLLTALHQPQAAWERALDSLAALAPAEAAAEEKAAPVVKERRVVFEVKYFKHEVLTEDQRALSSLPSGLSTLTDASDDEDWDVIDALSMLPGNIEDKLTHLSNLTKAKAEPASSSNAADAKTHSNPGSTTVEHDRVFSTRLQVEPRLQSRRGQGFTPGRPLALNALTQPDQRLIISHPRISWWLRPSNPDWSMGAVENISFLCASRWLWWDIRTCTGRTAWRARRSKWSRANLDC